MSEPKDSPFARFIGKWPGDETEEEISEALNQLGKCQKCKKLEDLLRWRDSSKELPTEHGEYLVHYLQSKGDGYARMVVHWNGSWPLWFPNRKSCYWRPIGPLPGEGGGDE